MNTQVETLNLREAVVAQILAFVNANQPFSRYDITTALRNRVNSGNLEIPDVKTSGGSVKFWVQKTDVDSIFEDVYANPSAYNVPALTFTFKSGQGYRTFEAASPSSPTIPTVQMASTQVAGGYVSTPVSVTPPASTSVIPPSSSPLNDSEIRRRVDTYLKRCQASGTTPTLKQIQSAIKRGNKSTGLSYGEIRNVASSLGYRL